MKYVLLKQESKDWEIMWNWLAVHPINEGIENPSLALNQEEAWQYMGSYKSGDKLISEFRHRLHPTTNNIHKLVFKHDGFEEESIAKEINL